MARYNQSSGRTMTGWAAKCETKRARAQKLADQLGGEVVGLKVGGAGVPGNLENRFDIRLADGTMLTMKQAKAKADAALVVKAVNGHDKLVEALHSTRQQLADLHAAIADQGLADRFVDDSINMISEGQTAIEQADAALDAAR